MQPWQGVHSKKTHRRSHHPATTTMQREWDVWLRKMEKEHHADPSPIDWKVQLEQRYLRSKKEKRCAICGRPGAVKITNEGSVIQSVPYWYYCAPHEAEYKKKEAERKASFGGRFRR